MYSLLLFFKRLIFFSHLDHIHTFAKDFYVHMYTRRMYVCMSYKGKKTVKNNRVEFLWRKDMECKSKHIVHGQRLFKSARGALTIYSRSAHSTSFSSTASSSYLSLSLSSSSSSSFSSSSSSLSSFSSSSSIAFKSRGFVYHRVTSKK